MPHSGWIRSTWAATHPGPTLVVTALSAALGAAAGLDPARLAVLTAAVFAGQVSVGLSNDAIDAGRDAAAGRPDKPVATGALEPTTAMAGAAAAAAAAVALTAVLGWGALAAHATALALAWAYNAGVKSTPASIVPFLISFGLFPSIATLAAPVPQVAPGWATVAGGALGAAVHLTNVLPDLEDDRATGVRGLPHRMGARASAVAAACGVLGGAIAVLLGAGGGLATGAPPLVWLFLAAVAVIAVLVAVRVFTRPPDRVAFRLVLLAALLLAVELVILSF